MLQSSWPGFELYVIARLPQLERLDGKEITRTDRIRAVQQLPSLCQELAPLAEEVRGSILFRGSTIIVSRALSSRAMLLNPRGTRGHEPNTTDRDVIKVTYIQTRAFCLRMSACISILHAISCC